MNCPKIFPISRWIHLKPGRWVLACAFLLALPLYGEVVDRIALIVGKEVITLSELSDFIRKNVGTTELSVGDKKNLLKRAADYYIEKLLVTQEAGRLKINVTEQEIQRAIKNHHERMGVSEEELYKLIEKQGVNQAEYRKEISYKILSSKLIGFNNLQRVTITEKEVLSEMKKRGINTASQAKIRSSHIVIKCEPTDPPLKVEIAKKRGEEILARIKKGEIFEELAKKYSEHFSAKAGGDVGFFTKGTLDESLENVLFSMKIGEVRGPVRSSLGFHIVKVTDIKMVQIDKNNLLQLQKKIMMELQEKAITKNYNNWIYELKKKAFIKYFL